MRFIGSAVFAIFIIDLLGCLVKAYNSRKEIGRSVSFLLASLTLPVFGNLIILTSTTQSYSALGYYMYFFGMDIVIYSLLNFTNSYCEYVRPGKAVKGLFYVLLSIDVVQYIIDVFLRSAFQLEMILLEDQPYYRVVPYMGQMYHRGMCYGLFAAVMVILFVNALKATRIYAEKYVIIILSIGITGLIEAYYIISRRPVDMSMTGLAVFGLLIYYFALCYRPLKILDRMLASIISDTKDAIFFFDENGKCIWINEPGCNLIGISNDNYDDVKVNLRFLFGDIDFDKTGWSNKVTFGTGDEAQYTHIEMRELYDKKNNSSGSCLIVRDITEDQRALKREMYNSTHDSLTGFYTKEYLFDNITRRLREDTETDYMAGYMEISNLNLINDVFGSEFAELTIKKTAELIQNNVSKKTMYGRLSNNAFGILIDKEDFLSKPSNENMSNFTVKGYNLEHRVQIKYGIYDFTRDEGDDIALFFDSARLATTKIKDNYQGCIAYYDDELRNKIIHNQLISSQVHNAMKTNQIRPYLQPIVNGQGLLAGAEALVRWIHPDEGFMNPGDFIPLFERNGLIAEVDRHMWKCACKILADWKERGIEAFISVNISPKDFFYMDVVSVLTDLTREYGIDPVKLRVEITETVMAADSIDMLTIINDLKARGFIVEMDDFGSGYSSLNLLKDMNIDLIKIDMQFLKDSERNMRVNTIIKNIINMSGELNIDTLTEGVETAKQFENLYSMGCKLYQGYYFSKPVPLDKFEEQWFD